jgi:hypothetical protein
VKRTGPVVEYGIERLAVEAIRLTVHKLGPMDLDSRIHGINILQTLSDHPSYFNSRRGRNTKSSTEELVLCFGFRKTSPAVVCVRRVCHCCYIEISAATSTWAFPKDYNLYS